MLSEKLFKHIQVKMGKQNKPEKVKELRQVAAFWVNKINSEILDPLNKEEDAFCASLLYGLKELELSETQELDTEIIKSENEIEKMRIKLKRLKDEKDEIILKLRAATSEKYSEYSKDREKKQSVSIKKIEGSYNSELYERFGEYCD